MKTSIKCGALRCAVATLAGAILMSGTAVAAVPVYRIVLLPELPDTINSSAGAINDTGEVVGDYFLSDFTGGAVSWGTPPYAPQPLAALPSQNGASVYDVNDAGFVVGSASLDSDSVAVMWDPSGAIVELGDLPRGLEASAAYGINASNVAVGQGNSTRVRVEPVYWNMPGQTQRLNRNRLSGVAWAVNDSGVVAGHYVSAAPLFVTHAARWRIGRPRMQDLGELPGGSDFSKAYGINDLGQIVGTSQSDLGARAVLWDTNGSMTDLGDLGVGSTYVATDINQGGEILGYYDNSGIRRGFLWTEADGMVDVYDLIDPADPLREQFGSAFVSLSAINDSGLIVGSMYPNPEDLNQHAIVLVPQE